MYLVRLLKMSHFATTVSFLLHYNVAILSVSQEVDCKAIGQYMT